MEVNENFNVLSRQIKNATAHLPDNKTLGMLFKSLEEMEKILQQKSGVLLPLKQHLDKVGNYFGNLKSERKIDDARSVEIDKSIKSLKKLICKTGKGGHVESKQNDTAQVASGRSENKTALFIQIEESYHSLRKQFLSATDHISGKKTVKKLLNCLEEMNNCLKEMSGKITTRNVEVLEKHFQDINTYFCNLSRDEEIDKGDIIDQLTNLKKLIQTTKKDKSSTTMSAITSAVVKLSVNDTEPWYLSNSFVTKLKAFHGKLACVPNLDIAKRDHENNMAHLRKFLELHSLCKRIEYTGSVYEGVNISGDTPEFDVMFVADGKHLKLVSKDVKVKKGYSYIQPKDDMHNLHGQLDQSGCLDPDLYRQYFIGIVQQWINIMDPKKEKFKLRKHGVASQIDVLDKCGETWYHVDLVPCFHIEGSLYVPKPIDSTVRLVAWRHSFSLEEKQRFLNMDKHNECKRHCVRIVKAIFKHRTKGLFTKFTSYHIKTIAFHLQDDKEITWDQSKDLGKCVYLFLQNVLRSLEKGRLMHYFESSVNLLEIDKKLSEQMINTLKKWMESENKFYGIIDVSSV